MAETFKEYLIKQKKSPTDILAQIGIIVGTIILVAVAFFYGGSFIGPILIIGILFGVGFLFSRFNREYEYILTNNELDIDVIYNRSRRKRVMTIDMKKIEIMANIKDERHQAEINKGYKVINVSDNLNNENTYVILTQTPDKGACKVILSPNEAFVNDLFRQAPNKVFKKM